MPGERILPEQLGDGLPAVGDRRWPVAGVEVLMGIDQPSSKVNCRMIMSRKALGVMIFVVLCGLVQREMESGRSLLASI